MSFIDDERKREQDEHGLMITTGGDVALGLGGGLAIDLSDGSLGIKVGSLVIDLDGK